MKQQSESLRSVWHRHLGWILISLLFVTYLVTAPFVWRWSQVDQHGRLDIELKSGGRLTIEDLDYSTTPMWAQSFYMPLTILDDSPFVGDWIGEHFRTVTIQPRP